MTSATGTLAGTVGAINPLRYRGYYYDTETGYYYLQSRYYNPEWCRFINADILLDDGAGLFKTNVFAYCANNPVNRSDPTGKGFSMRTSLLAGIIDAVIMLIPALITFNTYLKARKAVQFVQSSRGVWVEAFKVGTERILSRVGLKVAMASSIANIIINTVLSVASLSIGSLIVMGIKTVFKPRLENRWERSFYWWGSYGWQEYIIFW